MPFACQQSTDDYRCYKTGELVVATTDPRAFKIRIRLHKKYCEDCRNFDDGKVHRFTCENRSGGASRLSHYKDTNYDYGLPQNGMTAPTTKKGTYEGGCACNGGATSGTSILSADSIEVPLDTENLDDMVKLFSKKGKRGK